MKHRLFSRSIALLVVFGLLLTGSILPVAATSISDAVGSSSNLILNDDFIKDDNLIISDEIILRADDPSIAEESTKRVLLHQTPKALDITVFLSIE